MVKYNPELNWDMRTIWFTRYPKTYRTQYQDIIFRMRRAQAMETSDKEQLKIDKKLDPTNLEDLPEYIWPFTYLFNKKKFIKTTGKKRIEPWDQSNRKSAKGTQCQSLWKEKKALNQWLDEQFKAGLIIESNSRYVALYFHIPKKDRSLWLVQEY